MKVFIFISCALFGLASHAFTGETPDSEFGTFVFPQMRAPQNLIYLMSDGFPFGDREFFVADENGETIDASFEGPFDGFYLVSPERSLNPLTPYTLSARLDNNLTLTGPNILTTNWEDTDAPEAFELLSPTLVQVRRNSIFDSRCESDTLVFNIASASQEIFVFEIHDADTDELLFFKPRDAFPVGALNLDASEVDSQRFYLELIDGAGNRSRTNIVERNPGGCTSQHITNQRVPFTLLSIILIVPLFFRRRAARRH